MEEIGDLGMGGFGGLGVEGAVIYVVRFHNEEQVVNACLYILNGFWVVTCTMELSQVVTT